MKKEEILFMFYDTDYRNPHPVKGPFHTFDYEKIGQQYYHTLEDLLKTHYADSIKKRMCSAKLGTKIKLFKFHTAGDYYIKRISREEADKLDLLAKIDEQYEKARAEQYRLSSTMEQLYNELLPDLRPK